MKKPTIVLLSAKSNHGKDFFATKIKEQLEKDNKKVLITHYADLLKYICRTFFDWDGVKDENGRHILQYVGTDIIRQQNPDYWVKFVRDFLLMFKNEWDYILIPDTRFPNEIDIMKECEDFKIVTVRIDRRNFKSPLTEEQQKHPSETALDNYSFDYNILNDTNDLNKIELKVRNLINFIVGYTKTTLYIDLDGTVLNTIKCITNLYNEDFKFYKGFSEIDWKKVETWDFAELNLASKDYVNSYFNQKRFFEKVETLPYAKYYINNFSKNYNIVFISKGDYANLKLKEKYVEENFPYAKFIGVDINESKSIVDMSNGVLIDDSYENLNETNAKIKICFGRCYSWNANFVSNYHDKFECFTWEEVDDLLVLLKANGDILGNKNIKTN